MPPLNTPPADEIVTKTTDDRNRASHPGGIALSYAKLHELSPEICAGNPFARWLKSKMSKKYEMMTAQAADHLLHGDARAAIVIATIPHLLVAAYTDELDCIAILQFPSWLIALYDLRPGTRLLTVNTYKDGSEVVRDLHPGPQTYGQYSNFYPYIAEFLSDGMRRIDVCKTQIPTDEWERTWRMGKEYLRKYPNLARDGRPGYCGQPAETIK
jgi:hypothetical protein